jgi:hypothetical protein
VLDQILHLDLGNWGLTPILYRTGRVPKHPGNPTHPQNRYRSPSGRVALRGVIGFAHLGHTGAAAANISGKDKAWRIFLVELPIPTINRSFVSNDCASRAPPAR